MKEFLYVMCNVVAAKFVALCVSVKDTYKNILSYVFSMEKNLLSILCKFVVVNFVGLCAL